jgi:hypothetical protein
MDFGQTLSDTYAFSYLVFIHWGAYVIGGAPWVADSACKRLSDRYAKWSEHNKPLRRRIEVAALLLGLLVASFQAWQYEHRAREGADIRARNIDKRYAVSQQLVRDLDNSINGQNGYKDQIAKLEREIIEAHNLKPRVVYERVPASGTHDDAAVIGKLSEFVTEGKAICDEFDNKDDAQLIQRRHAAWSKKVSNYLTLNLGTSYVAQFQSAQGEPEMLSAHSTVGNSWWALVRAKITILNSFISELRR